MKRNKTDVIKSSGEKVKFSFSKLRNSLLKSGADETIINTIINQIKDDLYHGISTKELYNRAYALLKDHKGAYAARYKLKNAIYELGPSGFPFEKFIAEILKFSGYQTSLNIIMQGKCVSHEVDILAVKDYKKHYIECKFHSEEGRNCDVKVPLYINSRFEDIYLHQPEKDKARGWLVTNTRFTLDAITYGECVGLKMLSWNYPEKDSLKELIDTAGAYPLTSSTLLSDREKQSLLKKDIVMAKDLLDHPGLLDEQGISENRKKRIISEFKMLCKKNREHEK